MRPRNNFLEQLKSKREAAKKAEAPAPVEEKAPEPEPSAFTDPDVRAEHLSDELKDARAEVAREKERRRAAESRASKLEADAAPTSRGALFANLNRKTRRPPWR